MDTVAVGAWTDLSRFSTPPADLAGLPTIDFDPPQRAHQWRLDGSKGEAALVSHQPRLVKDDLVQMRLSALRGIGVVQLPAFVVDDDLAAGTLVNIIP